MRANAAVAGKGLQPYPGEEAEAAPHAPLIGKAVLHQIEGGMPLTGQHAPAKPVLQGQGSPGVPVVLRRIIEALLSILKPDNVVGAAAVVAKLVLSGDHIIRGSDYRGKVADSL